MIHDKTRVAALRSAAASNIELINKLESQISKGELPQLKVARLQLEDIETLYLAPMEKDERTPEQEALWLFAAESMLRSWTPELTKLSEQFRKYGSHKIEIIET